MHGCHVDEFGGSTIHYTFGTWDNYSALLNPQTKAVDALVGSLQLLNGDIELAILDKIRAKGRHTMLANGAPRTLEYMKRARNFATHFVENGAAW